MNEVYKIAWIYGNSKYADDAHPGRDNAYYLHPVGVKVPNGYGLYDTIGNAREWCLDWYGDYVTTHQTSPAGPTTGTKRVMRGGAYCVGNYGSTCSVRASFTPETSSVGAIGKYDNSSGVRLACPIPLVFK